MQLIDVLLQLSVIFAHVSASLVDVLNIPADLLATRIATVVENIMSEPAIVQLGVTPSSIMADQCRAPRHLAA